nr:general transcription factor IIE subunit 1 [Ipomoea trifida]GMD00001.1 general transcription factor IIE subunit 1 [Ipomoea batatas]
MKVLPPWMIKQGMNLTKEQRGEAIKQEKMDGTSAPMGLSDDKKSEASKDDVKNIQDEYVKAYYAALLQQQYHQQEAAAKKVVKEEQSTDDAPSMSTERQVGMKFKREDDDEGDDVEWEDAIPAGSNTTGNFKVGDLNVQAEATEDEDDDDIDWEEG